MKVSLSLSPWQLVVVVELVVSSRPDHHPHCRLDSAQDYGTVCVKIPTTDCTTETTRNGVRIVTDQDCYKVVKTVCTEDTEVVNNEVCATYYEETKVQAEIKTVTASFQRVCRVEEVCPPVEAYGTAAGEACRYRKTRQVCYKEPRLVPLVKKVEERRCMEVAVVKEGLMVNINKCDVTYQEEECYHAPLSLPSLACPSKMTNVKNIYEYVEETGYERSG